MKIIKLTDEHGDIMYLNTNCILFFESQKKEDTTAIYTTNTNEHSLLYVVETPEEILSLIEKD